MYRISLHRFTSSYIDASIVSNDYDHVFSLLYIIMVGYGIWKLVGNLESIHCTI